MQTNDHPPPVILHPAPTPTPASAPAPHHDPVPALVPDHHHDRTHDTLTLNPVHAPLRPLRLLSLDGGGIKGYMILLILERLFRDQFNGRRPCEVFDLIGGTSTGGLIAIMLGRLGMTIAECLEAYQTLSKRIFAGKWGGGKREKVRKAVRAVLRMKFYDIKVLEEAIKEVIVQREYDAEAWFTDELHPSGCKVMVCVTRKYPLSPEIFRSYPTSIFAEGSGTESSYRPRIYQAGCATAAAPFYFRSVQFEPNTPKYCDGGLRRNNPVSEVLSEARRIWGSEQSIGCLLSVGCGVGELGKVKSGIIGFAAGAIKMITAAEDTRRDFERGEGNQLMKGGSYFRFSVLKGASKMELDDWRGKEMAGLADYYLGDVEVDRNMRACRGRLNT